jgi:predicted neutral ceramidase superfamily lipid hydrolase
LLFALSRLHEARARIDKLEHAVVDAATQSERAREKMAYGRFEKEVKLGVVERDEANELVKNVCAMLKGVVQPALA